MSTVPPRRKPKDLPKLPASAFSPPTSSAGDSFPGLADFTALQPAKVIDANVVSQDTSLAGWQKEAGPVLTGKLEGVVFTVKNADATSALQAAASQPKILSVSLPFSLESGDFTLASVVSTASAPVSLHTVFQKASAGTTVERLKEALSLGRPVDIEIQGTLSESLLEGLEDILTKAIEGIATPPPIILSNLLPPPHDLELPIVKLMNHPTYLAFQSQVAALSLFSNVYVKFLPPVWDAPTPQTPFPGSPIEPTDTQQLKEWKRRIKMYLGPVVEAFGYQRIIFGSSPPSSGQSLAHVGNWFEIARESIAELVADQETVDAIFFENAYKVYSKAT